MVRTSPSEMLRAASTARAWRDRMASKASVARIRAVRSAAGAAAIIAGSAFSWADSRR